jgi:hypothetical protein
MDGEPENNVEDDNFDKPLVAKPFMSTTIDDTLKEIFQFQPTTRPLIKV